MSIYSYFVIGTLINTFLMAPVVLRTYRQEKLEGSYRCASIKLINYLTLLLKTMNICNKNKNSGFNLHVYLSIALTYSIFLQGLWDYVWVMSTAVFFTKHHVMVYKVLWRNRLPVKPGTQGQTPSLFANCTGFFYVRHTIQGTNCLTSHPKDKAKVKCPVEGHRWHDNYSSPHPHG